MSHESICSVCSRLTGFGDEDRFEPPVNLARCPAPGGLECRAVAQAVAPLRRENEVLRSNCDHLSSENASLSSQVESMALRIESLAEELAKPEDVRLREVLDALEGRAVIFDGLGARVGHLLDEMDEWIWRAGEAERAVEAAQRRLACLRLMLADRNAIIDEYSKPIKELRDSKLRREFVPCSICGAKAALRRENGREECDHCWASEPRL